MKITKDIVLNFTIGLSMAIWSAVVALVLTAIAGIGLRHPGFAGCFSAALGFCGIAAWIFGRVAFELAAETPTDLDDELSAHRRVFNNRRSTAA